MEKTPYSLTREFIATLIRNENVGYVVHGSDIAVGADGCDAYQAAREVRSSFALRCFDVYRSMYVSRVKEK